MDFFRKFLQRMRAAPSDEELGRRSSVYPDDARPDGRQSISAENEDPTVILATSERLREFRMLVGITTHPSFKAPRGYSEKQRPVITSKGRPAPNLGIYPIVVKNEYKTKTTYQRFQIIINTCLAVQLIVAATLTALGASSTSSASKNGTVHSSHSAAVTAFGGLNTVIAGFLTYLKGSGLPMRYKYYAHEWSKVREYIENVERDLGTSDRYIDFNKEVNKIRQMYEECKADVDANTPDRFASNSRPAPFQLPPSVTSKEHDEQSEMSGARNSRIVSDIGGLKSKYGSTTIKEVSGLEHRVAANLENRLTANLETEGKKIMIVSDHEADRLVADRAKYVGDMEKDIESSAVQHARDTVSSTFDHVEQHEKS